MEFPSITATRSPFRTPSDSKPRARALLRAFNSEYETLSFWCLEMTLTSQLSQSNHPSTQSKWYNPRRPVPVFPDNAGEMVSDGRFEQRRLCIQMNG